MSAHRAGALLAIALGLLLILLGAAMALAAPAGRPGSPPAPAAPPRAEPPRAALKYRNDLIRSARLVWGIDAPVAILGAQIHAESAWRETARSAYAEGLAQFTPDTARWIAGVYRAELGEGSEADHADPRGASAWNPAWALRAVARYDKHLLDRITAATPCDRWAFALSAYNGGLGWVVRDKRLAAAAGQDPARWWGHVERHSPRSAQATVENRGYPRKILLDFQHRYRSWGPGVACDALTSGAAGAKAGGQGCPPGVACGEVAP